MASGDVILSGSISPIIAEAGGSGYLNGISPSVSSPWRATFTGSTLGPGGQLVLIKSNSSGLTNCPFDLTKSYTVEIKEA